MTPNLTDKKCIPCSGEVPPLEIQSRLLLLDDLDFWTLTHDGNRLYKMYDFPDFQESLDFTIMIGNLAQEEWHHPDIKLGWGYLEIEVYTHKINSLVESDFIFASKVDELYRNLIDKKMNEAA